MTEPVGYVWFRIPKLWSTVTGILFIIITTGLSYYWSKEIAGPLEIFNFYDKPQKSEQVKKVREKLNSPEKPTSPSEVKAKKQVMQVPQQLDSRKTEYIADDIKITPVIITPTERKKELSDSGSKTPQESSQANQADKEKEISHTILNKEYKELLRAYQNTPMYPLIKNITYGDKENIEKSFIELINSRPYSDKFYTQYRTLSLPYEHVWQAILTRMNNNGENIYFSLQVPELHIGILTTYLTRHGMLGFPTYDRYDIFIEKRDESNTKVIFKLFSYYNGNKEKYATKLIIKPIVSHKVKNKIDEFVKFLSDFKFDDNLLLETEQYAAILQSESNPEKKKLARKIYSKQVDGTKLFATINDVILNNYQKREEEKGYIDSDTLAWLCKALASSRMLQYKKTLLQISNNTSNRHVKKHIARSIQDFYK